MGLQDTVVVVGLVRGNAIYLSRYVSGPYAGRLICPGGRGEKTDVWTELAAAREIKEETGLDVTNRLHFLFSQEYVTTSGKDFTGVGYVVVLKDEEIPKVMEPDKHTEWVLYDIESIRNDKDLTPMTAAVLSRIVCS